MKTYKDKVTIELLLNHAFLAIDMLKDVKLHKLYTQALTNVTLSLLQRPKIYKSL